jgi:tetratricopeptide (TPR) repeat protein
MMAQPLHSNDVASAAAAEGNFALGIGDTVVAAEKYALAGKALEKEAAGARKASDRNIFLFLAASQYFHGGEYKQALKIGKRVEERLLPDHVRPLFASFVRDATDRAREGYIGEMRKKIYSLTSTAGPGAALELLKSHPYVFDRTQLAFARAFLCEELGRYHAAAIFHASAMKFQPDDPKLAYMSTAVLQWLPTVGRLDEALEYIRYQIEEIGHAVTYIAASVLGYRRAMLVTDPDNQGVIFREVVSFFEKAWKLFQQMPNVFQRDLDLRRQMALCFEIAGFVLWRMKEAIRSAEVCETALRFDPHSSGLRTMRGVVTYPSAGAVADLEQAVKLGEKNYYPYYYLAQHAFKRENFLEAKKWITQALSHNPSRTIGGQLYGWLAICLYHEGASVEEIEGLFAKAHELAPGLPEIEENHQKFRDLLSHLDSRPSLDGAKATVWEMGDREEDEYLLSSVLQQENRVKAARGDAFKRGLQPV